MYLLGSAYFYRCTEDILAVWEDGWTANNKDLISESSSSFCCLLEAAPSPCSQPRVYAGKPIYLVRAMTNTSWKSLTQADSVLSSNFLDGILVPLG